jgi:hypothetical protein
MSIADHSCPYCGNTNKHRNSSEGTIQRCKWCKKEYVAEQSSISSSEYEKPSRQSSGVTAVWLLAGLFVLCALCGGLSAILSNKDKPVEKQVQVAHQTKIEEVSLPKEKPIVVQYDPSKNKDPIIPKKEESKKVELPEEKPVESKPTFIGDEIKATELLTQAKFLRGTNQIDRCKTILNDILTNHTDTKAAIEAKKMLMALK